MTDSTETEALQLKFKATEVGLGEGGEQNAPLGRAVIGGLLLATPTTLLFVPIMYSWLRRKPPVDLESQIAEEAGETPSQPGRV